MTFLSLRSGDVGHRVGSNAVHTLDISVGSQQCLKEEINLSGVLILSFFKRKGL